MKKLILILSLFSLIFPRPIFSSEKINKFGIHILEPNDLSLAQELVNSSGGEWGWVTVVIRDDDMNFDKWQGFMDECREKHLVPLVRMATHLEGENWVKPNPADSEKWANFLGSLNWPTENQYVILFNEPNHAKEWGGEVNPREYSRILSDFSEKLKVKSLKFRILNAGLDLAAPNSKTTMEAFRFMQEMNWEVPGIFEKLDGWTSHSYPNHGFLGKPWDLGKTSIKGYEWELNILKNTFKIRKELPVLITETGWPKESSKFKVQSSKLNGKYYSPEVAAEYIENAFENVWLKDKRVLAVTPFVLNYPGDLFADFSWLDKEGKCFPQFETVKNIAKISWWPKQEIRYELISLLLPPFLPADTQYHGRITLKNTGQSIWGENGQFIIHSLAQGGLIISDLALKDSSRVKPKEIVQFDFTIISSSQSGEFEFNWENLSSQKLKVFPSSFISQAKYGFWEKVVLKVKNFLN